MLTIFVQDQIPAGTLMTESHSRTYNIFRSRFEPAIFCVVLEDRPVPSFIVAPAWKYGGRMATGTLTSLGFNERTVADGAQLGGFCFLYHLNS